MRITEFINEDEQLDEKFIPSVKPVDYTIQIDQNFIHTPFKIGNKFVQVEITIGATTASRDFLSLLKPESLSTNGNLRAGDMGFQVGDDAESMTDQKNTGNPIKEAARIGKAVAYILNDMVYRHRSKLPFITFWASPGENRDSLYKKISQEFTESWKNWGYINLDPAAVHGKRYPYSYWIWAHKAAFANWTLDQDKIQQYLAVTKL